MHSYIYPIAIQLIEVHWVSLHFLFSTARPRVVGPNFSSEKKMFPDSDSSHYKKNNGSWFMSLCEILSKLQMCKVTNFMMFSNGLLILYSILLI